MTNEEIVRQLEYILSCYDTGTKLGNIAFGTTYGHWENVAASMAGTVETLLGYLKPKPKFKVNDFVIVEWKIYKITSCAFSKNDGEYIYEAMSVAPLTAVHQFKEKYIRTFDEFVKEHG